MLPDRVSNPGPLTYESDALPIALRGPALQLSVIALLPIRYNGAILRKMECNAFQDNELQMYDGQFSGLPEISVSV